MRSPHLCMRDPAHDEGDDDISPLLLWLAEEHGGGDRSGLVARAQTLA